jgi:GTP-binding protein
MKTGCATLLLMNKWDISRTDIKDATVKAERKLKMRPPVRACSALTGRGIEKGLAAAIELAHRSGERIATSDLNRFVADTVAAHPPPERRGRRLKLLYAAQIDRRPPRIAIQVNDRSLINRDWAFYLENQMRDAYDLQGVPLVIDYVPRSGTRKGSKRGKRGARDGAEA